MTKRHDSDDHLLEAARKGNLEGVREALAAGASPDARHRENGRTPLHEIATRANAPALGQLLLDAGATVNAQAFDGATPLFAATVSALNTGKTAYITWLLEHGANSLITDGKGLTPLARAKEGFSNFYATVGDLLETWEKTKGETRQRDDFNAVASRQLHDAEEGFIHQMRASAQRFKLKR